MKESLKGVGQMASCLAVNNRRSIAQCKLSVCVCVHLLRQPNSAAMQSYLQMPSAPAADEPLKTGSLHSARVFVVSKSVRVLLKRFIGLPSSVSAGLSSVDFGLLMTHFQDPAERHHLLKPFMVS